MSKIYVIEEQGEKRNLPDEVPTLKALQEAVGGYIEILDLANDEIAVLDEDAAIRGRGANLVATRHILNTGTTQSVIRRPIYGPVVIMPASYFQRMT